MKPGTKRILKYTGLVIAALVLLGIVIWALGILDIMGYTATGSVLLSPNGTAIGKALVVYNPGLSGAPKDVATHIADDLQARGYEVMLAGVKSTAAANISGYDVIVAGGPIYDGKVSSLIYSYLQTMSPLADVKVGAFASGTSVTANGFPAIAWLKVTAVLNPGDNGTRAKFLSGLLN